MTERVALYVDGFNLYHAIDDLNEPFLKWLNLDKLGRIIIPQLTHKLVKVVYCTAIKPGDSNKQFRHEEYIRALQVHGVVCVTGHYVNEDMDCRTCGADWKKPTEKETDINVALHLITDGLEGDNGAYDEAYLVTSDSDHAATAKMFKKVLPGKKLISVAPPGRNFSVHITNFADGKVALNKDHLERSLFGPIEFKQGMRAGRRPREYNPREGWVSPELRPR